MENKEHIKGEKSKEMKPPKHIGKKVWASLEKEPSQVISEAFSEAISRDSQQKKQWVALVDGNKTQLRLLEELAQKNKINLTIVLDLIHVIEYLWKAAFVFDNPSSLEAEDWVNKQFKSRVLEKYFFTLNH